jgi:3-hydroxy-5-methyl-1-naphthoate 3-O-methyltransferase
MPLHEYIRRLDALANGYQRAQILFTAVRGGLFACLSRPRSAEEVAETLGWAVRGTRMLLDGLVALDLVEKDDQSQYKNTEIAAQCLVPGAPMDQTHILEHKANAWDRWSHLPEAVRTGKPIPSEPRTGEELRAFILGMQDIAQESARMLVSALDLSRYRFLLDVGAGSGAYTAAILDTVPALQAVAFDRPEVVPITQSCLASKGCLDRVRFVPGDLTRDSLGEGYDLILVSNVLHSFGEAVNRDLVRKCHEALVPGGLLILKDFLRDPGGRAPAYGLLFALHMLITTEEGGTYSLTDAARWTDAAGYLPGRCIELTPQSRLWLAEKPVSNAHAR